MGKKEITELIRVNRMTSNRLLRAILYLLAAMALFGGLERGIHCTIPLFLFSIGYLSSVRASGSGIDTSFSNWGRS